MNGDKGLGTGSSVPLDTLFKSATHVCNALLAGGTSVHGQAVYNSDTSAIVSVLQVGLPRSRLVCTN